LLVKEACVAEERIQEVIPELSVHLGKTRLKVASNQTRGGVIWLRGLRRTE
jgi:hypothetical protein